MNIRFVDELEVGFGWIACEPAYLQRASHALVHEGRVWLFDPVDGVGLDERIRSLGTPAGVVQLIDRHDRDCAKLARGYGVPLHATPFTGIRDSPFEVRSISRLPLWKEVAVWWPERRILVVGDALGTLGYFRARTEKLGPHPLLRPFPPRALAGLDPEHVLCGHGRGIHGPGTPGVLRDVLAHSRSRIPSWLVALVWRGLARRSTDPPRL